ncbi:hypothetical protein Fcan01_00565 [Folsomia candida]|uniref:Uncharacterized protein n=1 Tax=Folsomia candida TaxID=158441 RepID=A0A226EX99_FOLCA|nr:hypothetical protein Fcan01_00565 [Folsomia candida]
MANHRTGNSLSAADQLSDKVFSNDLIISTIYGHLGYHDAQTCLALNRVWYSTCLIQFNNFKRVVSIQDGASLTEYLTYFASQPQSDNVHVAFRFSANLNLSQSNLVKRFFTNFGPQMKSLDAFVNYRTRFELAQFAFILKKLTKLEELRLHLNKKDNDRNLNSDGIALKKLRKLILHYKSDFPWETTDIVEHFLLSRNFFPALETIELPPFSTSSSCVDLFSTTCDISNKHKTCVRKYVWRRLWTIGDPEGSEDFHFTYLKAFSLPINLLREKKFVGLYLPRIGSLTKLEVEFIMGKVEIGEVDRWKFTKIDVSQHFPNLKQLKVKVTFVVIQLELVNPYVSRRERKDWRDGICKLFKKLEKFVETEVKVVDQGNDGVYDAHLED